jgi:hypothetical protein
LSLFETEEAQRRENETAIFLFEGKLYKRLVGDRKLTNRLEGPRYDGQVLLNMCGCRIGRRLFGIIRESRVFDRDLGSERRRPILATIYSVFFVGGVRKTPQRSKIIPRWNNENTSEPFRLGVAVNANGKATGKFGNTKIKRARYLK